MKNYTQTKRKLTYKTCTIFRVLQANERQSGRRLEATGKVAHVASVSVCFRSKDEERDFLREKNGTRCKKGREGEGRKFPSVLLLAPFSARSLTLDPRPFLRNSTETLATQATGKGAGKKMTLFFFSALYSAPGGEVIPCLRSPENSKEKRGNKQRGSSSDKRTQRAGTFPQPPSVFRFVSPLIFSVFYHEAFLFILYADKKYKTRIITTTVSSKQLYIKRGSPNLFLKSFFFLHFDVYFL